MKHIISLGAGVQSSTMALMAAHGEITPMPDAAIFADTQAEPNSVYIWLDWLEKMLPFPTYRVTIGSLTNRALTMKRTADDRLYSKTDIPFFTKNADGSQGKIRFRSCTRDFKLAPLRKKQREIAAVPRGYGKRICDLKNGAPPLVISWQGISFDEIYRMKPSREAWCEHRFPLIDLRMSRGDCLKWMEAHSYPKPPRSACIYCPFHNDQEWIRLRDEEPQEFMRAVAFESALQQIKSASSNFRSTPFLHRSLVPLKDVQFKNDHQDNLFNNECEGMCGV